MSGFSVTVCNADDLSQTLIRQGESEKRHMKVRCFVRVESLAGLSFNTEGAAVPAALAALEYWLLQLQTCEALQPLEEFVTFLCNQATYVGCSTWAKLKNLPDTMIGRLQDHVLPMKSRGDTKLLVIDAAHMFGATFNLRHFLYSAMLRDKHVTCYAKAGSCMPDSTRSLPVTPVEGGICSQLSEGGHSLQYFLAPILLLSTLSSGETTTDTNLKMVQEHLLKQGLLFGIEVQSVTSVQEAWDLEAQMTGSQSKAGQQRKLPARFTDASLCYYSTQRLEHPVYTISSGELGKKAPLQAELHISWNGIKGGLNGLGNTGKSTGLKTGLRKSKICRVSELF